MRRDIALALADIALLQGDATGARAVAASVASDEALRARMRYVMSEESPAPAAEVAQLEQPEDDSTHPLRRLQRGDRAWITGRTAVAVTEWEHILDATAPRFRLLRLFALARLAESQGREDAKRAAATLQQALESHQDRDLLRHLVRARARYFQLQSSRTPDPAAEATAHRGS
jgi:hypothetical protein